MNASAQSRSSAPPKCERKFVIGNDSHRQHYESLEERPHAKGSMFDNTMLFYFPENGETHHGRGTGTPFVILAGDNTRLDLRRRYIRLPDYDKEGHKTLGNWYTAILNAYGNPIDHYGALEVALSIDQQSPIKTFLS